MISHPSRHCTVELQALPSRIGQVRRIVSAQLRYWHMDPLIDRASLGVTELLSNVHRHARPDKTCTVEIELLLDRLKVSVHDHDPRLPVVADAGPLATCGRGLAMVAAMSESWGVLPDDAGKVVWFTLPTSAAAEPAAWARRPHLTAAGPDRPRFTEVALVDHVAEVHRTEPAPARSAVPG
ncbi:ATP-binding protein [Actinospica acidiphila]|uniref:ATP-binding protein n=1 Tax=Streptomyces TaxID=1883 RepID=UPI000E0ABA38|nr:MULTISPECIES: ATP-binding protein [unclassified Streptomyces]AXI85403.1 ATP-binding protein [Streptomyces sp. ETH9427]MBQ0972359.1 ATP-binding protein [Streptomyces sp. RK31]NEA77870.1 ATP-binding protein [Actinospica acidiphila]